MSVQYNVQMMGAALSGPETEREPLFGKIPGFRVPKPSHGCEVCGQISDGVDVIDHSKHVDDRLRTELGYCGAADVFDVPDEAVIEDPCETLSLFGESFGPGGIVRNHHNLVRPHRTNVRHASRHHDTSRSAARR